MPEESEKRPEIVDAESGLMRTQREIQAVEKDLLSLREKLRVAEQKEIDARSKAGEDATGFEPTPDMSALLSSISKAEGSLGLLQLREKEQKKNLEKLNLDSVEQELLLHSRVILRLKTREGELAKELTQVQKELKFAEKRSAELADKIAARAEG
jgi:hypothetical protein